MIKLIATDMDGTFLDNQKQWDKQFIDQFYQLKNKGIKFCIASGNQYYRLFQKFLPMSPDMMFIADNGSVIADGPNILYTNTIDPKDVESVKAILKEQPEIFAILSGRRAAYALNANIAYKNVVTMYYASNKFVESFDEIDDEIIKIAIYDPNYTITKFYDAFASKLPDNLKVATSGNEWMDIQNKTINKGIAIQKVQELLQIKENECMAFGDQMNDYELLQSVKYSFAMQNAIDPIKHIAYGVCPSNNNQGVLMMIQDLLDVGDYE